MKRYRSRPRLAEYRKKLRSIKLITLAKLFFVGVIVSVVGFFVVVTALSFTLPPPDQIVRREGFSTKILDRTAKFCMTFL